ncbi:Cysteine--tRNA ligase [Candidatus Methanoperedenaceae archaeon GB50]|nr:Cysteine--tRNA ligase [Candidatus Methanoperedenaceae archaeon GB50]
MRLTLVLWQKGLNKTDKGKILSTFKELNQVLNIMDIDEVKLDEETLRLIKEREAARKRKDWARADALRQKLLSQGIEIIDTNQGPIWRIVQKKQS